MEVVPAPVAPKLRNEVGTQAPLRDHKVEKADKGEEGVP